MIGAATLRDLLSPQHLRSRIVLIVALVPLTFATLAAHPLPASAGGVHFDPESPAGKEYALPLSQARNEGAGKTGIGEHGTVEPAPLFGEGVSGRKEEPSSAPGVSGGGGGGGQGGHGSRGGTAVQTPSRSRPDRPGATIAAMTDDGYSMTTGALLAALVVAAGIGLGFALRGLGRVRST